MKDMRTDDKVCLVTLITTAVLIWVVFMVATANSEPKLVAEGSGISKEQGGIEVIVSRDEPKAFTAPSTTPTEVPLTNLGEFKLTAYCACEYCCGKSDGITASGAKVEEGRTVAADTELLPFGTTVMINGHEYVVEDRSGCVKDKHIDVYMESHDAAVNFGVQYAEVFIKNE